MKLKSVTRKTKDAEFNTAELKTVECGRMDYLGVDMAFIYIRGKLMFTMSEVARKLYPQWPRTTLNDRVKQLNIQWHTCTPKEIEKVLSVRGIVKLGVHCTLIAKEDLDVFSSLYKVGDRPAGSRFISKPTRVKETVNEKETSKKAEKQISVSRKIKRKGTVGKSLIANSTRQPSLIRSTNYSKQSQLNGNKSKTRVIVKDFKSDNDRALERHVVNEVNKAIGKHAHVVARYGSTSKQPNKIHPKSVGKALKKRDFSAVNLKTDLQSDCHGYIPTKRHRRKIREASSSDSDCVSYDSGVSSLQLDHGIPQKPGRKRKNGDVKPSRQAVAPKSQKQLKIKEVKRKHNGMKTMKAKRASKDIVVGTKRKGEIVKRGRKSKNGNSMKKVKIEKYNCPSTITKDLIMKMDLKHMNDKDLINSFSPPSSAHNTPAEDQPYLVKLMPVKPVWRVNSSFKFISHFQLPPSLVVEDGQLTPACSMICSQGQKPPSAHPIWKWKIGEPVISSRTVISYRMKKIKCV